MSSQFTRRLVTALLLILAAFGIAGSGFAVTRVSHTIICAADQDRREPRRAAEQPKAGVTRRPVCVTISRREPRVRDLSFHRWLFQRPPPAVPLFRA